MKRAVFVWIVLALAGLACNLTGSGGEAGHAPLEAPPTAAGVTVTPAVEGGPRYQSTGQGMDVTSTALGLQEIGQLVLTPSPFADGWHRLSAGQMVTLTWPEAPPDTARVTFYLTPTGTGTADAQSPIGTDANPGDGASLTWQVPSGGFSAHLQAVAYDAAGRRISASRLSQVYAE